MTRALRSVRMRWVGSPNLTPAFVHPFRFVFNMLFDEFLASPPRRLVRRFVPMLFAAFALVGLARAGENTVEYNRDIRPILSQTCFHCHGPDQGTREADLRLDTAEGASGVLVPGHADQSEIIRRILSHDADERMPPVDSPKKLTDEQKDLLARWVDEGAEYQAWWAFVPPRDHEPPKTKSEWPRNEIDRFVLARLEQEKLAPSPAADRATLLRRVTLDLTGLPPTPEETAAFWAAGCEDEAYELAVDRLLASPRYGEHMASYWLEAARYADTDGYQNDRYRYQHVWRDWVILAYNRNMPFDQFVVEQLAGDMLPGATLTQQIATGFCRNHRINSEDGSIPGEWYVENIVDRVDTLGTVFLGLTVGCARCHDHKYDPISQKEYYQLFAYFNNVPEWGVGPNNGNSPPFVTVPDSWPNLSADENERVIPDPVRLRRSRENENGNGLRRPQAGGPETIMIMHELAEPRPTYRLDRGLYNMPDKSEVLSAGVPRSLDFDGGDAPRDRLALAKWLVDPRNPLTSRVAVNRLWQQFYGMGLVKSSENFGAQGELPSHPELLDWLAIDFVRGGWDVKALQKKIVLSATYRQSSRVSRELVARDPDNRLLARGARFRLPAFALRDQALAVAGLLNEERFGAPTKPYMPPGLWESISNNKYVQDHGPALYRRSLYTFWRRTIPPPTMTTLNAADREVCVVRKDRTNTPLQALSLMNNITFVEASRFLAERMMREGGEGATDQIRRGFELAVGRSPTSDEIVVLRDAHEKFYDHFQGAQDEAVGFLSVGERPRDESLDVARHAALAMTASLILNLDETITRE